MILTEKCQFYKSGEFSVKTKCFFEKDKLFWKTMYFPSKRSVFEGKHATLTEKLQFYKMHIV